MLSDVLVARLKLQQYFSEQVRKYSVQEFGNECCVTTELPVMSSLCEL